jgi:hypothetical protein
MFMAMFVALITQQGGPAPPPPPVELRVVVGAPVYHPDGSVSGESAALSGLAPSVRYVFSRQSLCDSALTAGAEPRDAGYGWRVAAHVVSATGTEVVVSVDWRRLWDRGQALANGPGGTAQLTLHLGDRIPLDHIPNGLATDVCRAVGMGLEMRLGRAPAMAQAGRATLPLGAREGGAGLLDVDLWLVHTTPLGGEQAQHQKVRLSSTGGPFTFAPVKFTTRQGEVGVELNGTFQRYTAAGGGEYMLLGMSRVVTGASAPAGGHTGVTSSLVTLPRPDEVLSFEMATAGAGGRGGARSRVGGAGGSGGGGGGMVSAGGGGATARGSGVRGGGSGAMGPASAERALESLANAMQVAATLDGHRFALRVRVTPVSGS